MYYIKLIILAILLTSCANIPNVGEKTSSGLNPAIQSKNEIKRYKTAITLLNNKKFEAAKKIFTEFTIERPELAGPHLNLAVIAVQTNQAEEAFELVKTALNKNPRLAQALNLLAFLEQSKGQFLNAKSHYKQAIKYKDDYAIAHYNLALLYDIYLQDIDNAITHYERYMQLTNNKDKSTADWLEHLKNSKANG